MMRFKQIKSSIAYRYALYIIFIVALQSLLFSGALLVGGVLNRSKDSVCQSFEAAVENRTEYFSNEMVGRWSNIDSYVEEVSAAVTSVAVNSSQKDQEAFLGQISDNLISMMRASGTTGGFFIFNTETTGGNHPALYFRDYDPRTNSADDKDIYLVMGPSDIVKRTRIPTDSTWHYGYTPSADNSDFYIKPYEAAVKASAHHNSGYWSTPFLLTEDEPPIITYSVPVFDNASRLRGIMGVEISVEYINTLLRSDKEIKADTPTYMIAAAKEDSGVLVPLIIRDKLKEEFFRDLDEPQFTLYSEEYATYRMKDFRGEDQIYSCIKPLNLYNSNVIYDQDPWVVAGLMEEDILFDFVSRLRRTYLFALVASMILGVPGSLIISRRIARPLERLADEVKQSDFTKEIKLKKTGLAELDQLSGAIETSNHNLLESTLKMSEIMDLLKIPIGVFEYKKGTQKVQVTNGIFEILGLIREESDSLLVDEHIFDARLQEIQEVQEPDEHNVYRLNGNPVRWIKISMTFHDDDRLGVVRDVTDEIREKHKIKEERDYDFLTQIYNRTALHREIKQQLELVGSKMSALVMLDLDGLKQINDTFGHKYGDIYIRETAVRLSKFPKDHTIVGRRSGDEFFVFFFGYDSREEIRNSMHKFYRDLEETPILFDNGEVTSIQISAGISWYGVDSFRYDEMLQHADLAMYAVKRGTKGGFCEFACEDLIEE